MKKRIIILMVLFFPIIATAQVNCTVTRPAFSRNITVQGADITVGEDVPIGTTIYSGFIATVGATAIENSTLTCRYNRREVYTLNEMTLLIGGGSEISPGIYATNLPGVGLKIHNSVSNSDRLNPLSTNIKRLLTTYNFPDSQCTSTGTQCAISAPLHFRFYLVKTGPIAAGQINANNFPRISVTAESPTPGAIVTSNEMAFVTFSGGLNVKAASCKTPGNYTVELGKHDMQEISTRDHFPWVDASIKLTGCPQFTGMPGLTSTNWTWPSTTPTGIPVYQNNLLEITLSPLTQVRTASEGTFLTEGGEDSASGLDIQLNSGTVGNNRPVEFNNPYTIDMVNDGRQSIDVPLVARYVRNGEQLSPGKATGKIVYLINYK